MKKLIRVVFYIRVSTEEQRLHGLSLDAQRAKLEEYANNHGFIIVDRYEDEGISGRIEVRKRPELQRMLKDAAKDKFDLIIFIKLDRYFRSVAEYHECQKILDRHNVKWSATEEKYDLTTANGRVFINMKLTMAEYEADQTGERIRLVNEYKVKRGYALSGAVPFGWIVKREGDHSIVIKDPEREHMVYDLLDHFELHHNVRGAIDYVQNKYGLTHTYKVLRNVLSTTFLYGFYRGNPNYCEAYISKERYDNIQRIISTRNVRQNKGKYIYLFSGLVKCGSCGCTMAGNTNPRPNKMYIIYRCNSFNSPKINCPNKMYKSEMKIEDYLLKNLREKLTEYMAESEVKERKAAPKKIDVNNIKSEIDRLNIMFQKSRISVEFYDAEYTKLEAKLKEAESIKMEPERDLQSVRDLLNSDIETIYSALDKEHKRAFWQHIIDRIIVNADSIDFTIKPDYLV